MPAINANKVLRLETVCRFFQCFARCSLRQGFVWLQMTGGLIESRAMRGMFLNKEEITALLNNGGYSDVGFPDHVVEV